MFKIPNILYSKYTKQLIGLCLFVTAFLFVENVAAQTYPVQTNVYTTPPYGKHLDDYYTSTKEKLVVSLLNRDNLKPVLEVRLRMTIAASNGLKIQSKEQVNYPTITLDAGIPTRLTQDDLAPYFLNINSQGYFDQGKLPDGQVEFTFQVIEKYTGKVLSAPATGRVWLSSQKPPLLRLPSNDESVAFRDPMNMKFQWEPQHKNLSQVEYEFELRELPNVGAAPQSVFMYAPIIHQEKLLYTSLIYDVMMPPLDPNKTYGWRVRAIAKDGIDELNMFENNGYSEIRWFRTQDNCPAPSGLSANLQGRRIDLNWFPGIGNNDYLVQYRPKYGTSETWEEQSTFENRASIYDVQRGMTYEYRVGGICTSGQPVYSSLGEIMVPAVDSSRLQNCGIMPVINFDNKELLPDLKVGDVVMLSDYPMTVTMATGSNGTFSGEGWVPVNWLLDTKWAVEFSNISVNTDLRMIRGSVKAKYDEKEGQIADIDEITEGGGQSTKNGIIKVITVDFIIPENPVLKYDEVSGSVIVYATDGQTKLGTITPPKNEEGKPVFPVTVQDKKGNIHKIEEEKNSDGSIKTDENGNPKLTSTQIGQVGDPILLNSANKQNISTDIAIVTFQQGDGVYAFDKGDEIYKKISKIKDDYEYLAQGKETYLVPWKFMPVGGSDKIQAKINIKAKNIDLTKVIFATPQGIRFKASYNEKEGVYTIDLAAGNESDIQEIYALYEESAESYKTLGKLNVITYSPQTNKLVVVQVNGYKIDENSLKEYLKEVYSPIAVTWEVRVEDYNYTGKTDGFFDKGSKLLSAYNEKMLALQNSYKSGSSSFDKAACYLFILNDSGDGKNQDTQGFMPRGKQFGYIFKKDLSNGAINHNIAHELGHGRWRLEHTFDSSDGILKEGKTNPHNLMDYTKDGVYLAKWQWARVNNPAWFTSLFEGDESGMSIDNPSLKCISDITNLGKIFYAPDGSKIKLSATQVPYAFFAKSEGELYGRLAAFKKDNKVYIYYLKNNNSYSGYWGVIGLGSQKNASNLIQLTVSTQTAKSVQIDDQCNYDGELLSDCKCSFSIGNVSKKDSDEYIEGGRPTIVATGDEKDLPCIPLPENQDDITLQYLKDQLYHKREIHCLEGLDIKRRQILIEELAEQTLVVLTDEDLLYRLIFSTPEVEEDQVFSYLKDKKLIAPIINKTQFTIHDEIALVFINWMRKQQSKFPVSDETKLIDFQKNMVSAKIAGDKIKFDFDCIPELPCSTEEVGIYDYVLVHFTSEVGGYKRNSLLKLPALEAYYLFNTNRREHLIKSGKLVAEIGLLALGVGEITAAYRVYKASRGVYGLYLLIKGSADMGVGLTDIVIQNSLAEEWSKTEEGRERLDRWNTICTWYVVGSLSASSIDLAVSKYGKNITSESKFDDICDELEGIAKSKKIISRDELLKYPPFNTGQNHEFADETLRLYNKAAASNKLDDWTELEKFFKRNNLNEYNGVYWPPMNGGYNLVDDVTIKVGDKFDRYQKTFFGETEGRPIVGGDFVSPINGTPYNYSSRALAGLETDYALYYKIEVLKDLPIKGQLADIVPWHGHVGGGKQLMFKFDSNYKNLEDLINRGYIKVTIEKSPNSSLNIYINKVIEK